MEPPTVQKNKIECKMTFRNEEPHVNKSFPRIRGDVPSNHIPELHEPEFSPHTRGCSGESYRGYDADYVFPAYAGMFLAHRIIRVIDAGFPRIRGDVPAKTWRRVVVCRFSPHTRGCSSRNTFRGSYYIVFPAYAGMFRVLGP